MSADDFYEAQEDEAFGRALLASSRLDQPSHAAREKTGMALGVSVAVAGALTSAPATAAAGLNGTAGAVAGSATGTSVSAAGTSISVAGAASTVGVAVASPTTAGISGLILLKSLSVGLGAGLVLAGGIHVLEQRDKPVAKTQEQIVSTPSATMAKPRPNAAVVTGATTSEPQLKAEAELLRSRGAQQPPEETRAGVPPRAAPNQELGSTKLSKATPDSSSQLKLLSTRERAPATGSTALTTVPRREPTLGSVATLPPSATDLSLPQEPNLNIAPVDSLAREVALVNALKRAVGNANEPLANRLLSQYFAQRASRELEREVRKLQRRLEDQLAKSRESGAR